MLGTHGETLGHDRAEVVEGVGLDTFQGVGLGEVVRAVGGRVLRSDVATVCTAPMTGALDCNYRAGRRVPTRTISREVGPSSLKTAADTSHRWVVVDRVPKGRDGQVIASEISTHPLGRDTAESRVIRGGRRGWGGVGRVAPEAGRGAGKGEGVGKERRQLGCGSWEEENEGARFGRGGARGVTRAGWGAGMERRLGVGVGRGG